MPDDNQARLEEISAEITEIQRKMVALQAEIHMLKLINKLLEL